MISGAGRETARLHFWAKKEPAEKTAGVSKQKIKNTNRWQDREKLEKLCYIGIYNLLYNKNNIKK